MRYRCRPRIISDHSKTLSERVFLSDANRSNSVKKDFFENSFNFSHYKIDSTAKSDYVQHMHTTYEFLLFISGDADYIIEDFKYTLAPLDLLIIPPTNYHYLILKSNKPYERFVLNFPAKAGVLDLLDDLAPSGKVYHFKDIPEIKASFEKTESYIQTLSTKYLAAAIVNLVNDIIFRITSMNVPCEKKSDGKVSLCSEIVNYLQQDYRNINNMEQIAKKFYICQSHLSHIFQSELGISPMKYVRQKKLLLAKTLISEGNMPTHIYEFCGFSSYNTFLRAYEKVFGCPPTIDVKQE